MMSTKICKSDLLNLAEVSRKTSLSISFLRQEIRSGRLKMARYGRVIRVSQQQLLDYIRSREEASYDAEKTA